MTGNLIDTQIRKYQNQNIQQPGINFQSQPQMTPQQGGQMVDTTPQADTFGEEKPKSHLKTFTILGTWLGLNKLTDLFNKGCTGDNYEKTIIGRLGNLGDKIANKGSKNKYIHSFKAHFGAFKSGIKKYIDSKPMLYAMFNTGTKPENTFVKGFMESQQAADLSEATRTITSWLDEMPKSFKEAGATKAEIQALKAKYGTNIFGAIKNQKQALQELQYIRCGGTKAAFAALPKDKIAEALKEIKIKHLGLDPATYKKVLQEPTKNIKLITEACRRGGKNAKAFFGRYSWLPGLGFFTKRSTNMSMSYNKLISDTKHATKLGRGLAKGAKLFMRGLTFGGGKLGSIMVAFGLGTALYNATQAPKKQKVGTAVAGTVDAVSWIASMPLAIAMMHGVNGLANVGLSKMQVGRYRVALRNFNKIAKAGGFATEAAYNTALKAVNDLRKVPGKQGKFTKAMSKLGHFMSIALENPTPFKEATKGLKGSAKMAAIGRNLKRMMPLLGKNIIGYPLRFAIYSVIFSPLVDKVISSVTSAIFGKPYEPEEEGVNEEVNSGVNAEKNEGVNEGVAPEQNKPGMDNTAGIPSQQTTLNPHTSHIDINKLPDENLIKQTVLGNQIMHDAPYIPSDKCEINGIVSPYDTVDREYIPQETAAPIPTNHDSDKSIVDSAIARADKWETKAMNALNGIY